MSHFYLYIYNRFESRLHSVLMKQIVKFNVCQSSLKYFNALELTVVVGLLIEVKYLSTVEL